MRNIIATWICIDTQDNGTYFPSAKGNSADVQVQEIYWRCISCFFTTARYYNAGATLMLFSNTDSLPVVDGVNIRALLEKLNVQFYTTPFEFVTPEGYYNQWRNQFYEFSIFKFISEHADFKDTDRLLLLDSDCVINGNLSALFNEVEKKGCITYLIDYNENHSINGNNRKQMKTVFEALLEKKLQRSPDYHAGEFYASTIQVMKTLIKDFYGVWKQLIYRHMLNQEKLHEEAHVLSYLYYKNGFDGGEANAFVKRLWTDPTSYRNIEKGDEDLLIWHLPAEKRFGFKKLFAWLQKTNFDVSNTDVQTLQKQLQRTFNIPDIPIQKRAYNAGKLFLKKLQASV